MRYAEFPPPDSLADIVRCFWTLTGSGKPESAAAADPALPDGSPELIVNPGDSFEYVPPAGRAVRQPEAFLVGQITRPFLVRPTGRVDLVAARFESHGASLLHRPMHELTNRWIALTRLQRPALVAAVRELHGVRSPEARVVRLGAALEALRHEGRGADPRVGAVVRMIRTRHGVLSFAEESEQLGLSLRSLLRLFREHVGVSPKVLARIARFQRVFSTVRDEPRNFARVAAACGYADQSHLVREFRELAGDAPARLLAGMPDFTAFFVA